MDRKYVNLDTTIVAIEKYSFKYLLKHLSYSYPSESFNRNILDYIGFYRKKPVSAITHFGIVKKEIEDAEVNGKYRLMLFGDKAREKATKVTFKKIVKLKNIVKADGGMGIQGPYFTKLEYLEKAETIPELFSFRKK